MKGLGQGGKRPLVTVEVADLVRVAFLVQALDAVVAVGLSHTPD